VQTTLSRPGIRIAGYSLAIVVTILLITVGRSHLTSSASAAAGIIAFLVLMLLFLAALKLIVPPRYISNPRFQRFDIALGFLSLASIAFVLTSLVLAVLATDGQSPTPTEFVVAALVAPLVAERLTSWRAAGSLMRGLLPRKRHRLRPCERPTR